MKAHCLLAFALFLFGCSQTPPPVAKAPPPPAPAPAPKSVISGCLADTRTEVPLGRFALALGQQVAVLGEDLHVRFDDIGVDPRCPPGKSCQGQLRLTVQKGDFSPALFLIYSEDQGAMHYLGYNLSLASLEPAFDVKAPYKSRYCAYLVVGRDGWQSINAQ